MKEEELSVDRCVCFEMTFKRMLAEGCESVEAAAKRWGCGTKCGLCKPYIERTIRTGEVRHPVLDANGDG